jgi:hypothetical protein
MFEEKYNKKNVQFNTLDVLNERKTICWQKGIRPALFRKGLMERN